MEKYKNVKDFCYNVWDRLNGVFQKRMGMKQSQNMSSQENGIEIFETEQNCQYRY